MTMKPGEELSHCVPAAGDHVAVIGQNRKLLIFPLAELPEMSKGAGVALQKYKDGGMADVKVFSYTLGLTWKLGANTRTETKLTDWLGARAQAGRLPPSGFPKSGKFGT
jgi:topoisomerase-4 subunit A